MPIRGSPNGARRTRPQPGRDHPEWVVAINRNDWSQSIGTGGRDRPVRAHIDVRQRYPTAHCRKCLAADRRAGRNMYFRNRWASAAVTYCHHHKVVLTTDCYFCNGSERLSWIYVDGLTRLICTRCRRFADEASDPIGRFSRCYETLGKFECDVISAMQGAAVSVQWTGSSDAGTFLRVVFDLARLLCRDTGHERRWYDFRDFPMNWFKQALRVGWCGWTHWPSLLDHPLSYSSITVRRCLLNAILIILRPDMEPMPYREHYWGFAPSVAWLFDVLDH